MIEPIEERLTIADLKTRYPDEWLLLGNPVMEENEIDVVAGTLLYHSKDKKEVCYMGRDKTANFETVTLIYTGKFRPIRKITGIFNRVKNDLQVQAR